MILEVVFTTLAFGGRCKVDQPTVWTFDAVHSCKISGWSGLDVRTEEGRFGRRVGYARNIIWAQLELVGKFF